MNDGSAQLLQVRRTTEVQDVVVQIDSTTNRPPFGLRLSKLRLEAPPANLFVPPSEFTKYPSAEALADELAARRNNIRRSSRYSPGPSTSP
jgi:hypothetical protein